MRGAVSPKNDLPMKFNFPQRIVTGENQEAAKE